MNKILLITFVTIAMLLSGSAMAHDDGGKLNFDREAFEARRAAYITAELGLTPEEASNFIPLSNELRKRKFEIGKECRKLSKEIEAMDKPSGADYNKVIDACLEVGLKEAELEKAYFEKFKKIIPPEKLYKYRRAEFSFFRQYMNDCHRHGKGRRGN